MTSRREGIPFEHLKLLLLDEAGSNTELGLVWAGARKRFPDAARDDLNGLFLRAMLELFEDGLVVLFRAPQPLGYRLELDDVHPLARQEVVAELENLIADLEPLELVWVVETKKGAGLFASLPSDIIAAVRGREPMDEVMRKVKRDNPDFLRNRDQYFRDLDAWAETGKGKKPQMPEWPESRDRA
jgi:hypothetical protein